MKFDFAKLALVVLSYCATSAWTQALPTALLIGNSSYQHTGALSNPSQDARALSQVLSKRGFEVELALDLGKEQMVQAIQSFVGKLKTSKRGVLYFAGHGVQVANKNYLLPVDVRSGSSEAIIGGSMSLTALLEQLASASPDAVAVILDACRDNPFTPIASTDQSSAGRNVAAGTSKSDGKALMRGLGEAGQDIPRGVLVAYGASAGQSAIDSLGLADTNPNGLFTRHLLHFMADEKLTLQQVLRRARDTVMTDAKALKHRQIPSVYDSSYPEKQLFVPVTSEAPTITAALPKQIRIVVPGARRGQSDFVARRFGDALKALGVETEVENVIDIRGDRVAAMEYPFDANRVTLLMSGYLSSLRREIAGDRRFQPVGMLTETPIVLAANKKHGINSMRSLMEKSQSRTGPWRVGSSGSSSDSDACSTVLKNMMGGDKVESIMTRGVGPALAGLATGSLDLFCDSQQVIDTIIKSDAVQYVANLQEDALSADGIATAQMQGFAWVVPNWNALFAPRELPSATVLALATVLQKVARDPAYAADLLRQAAKAASPEKTNPMEVEMSLRLGVELSK